MSQPIPPLAEPTNSESARHLALIILVGCSVLGLAGWEAVTSRQQAADVALYAAKGGGRDQVFPTVDEPIRIRAPNL
jgi:PleD family two-component response regulator